MSNKTLHEFSRRRFSVPWKIDENPALPLAIIEDTETGEGIAEMGEPTQWNRETALHIVTLHNAALLRGANARAKK